MRITTLTVVMAMPLVGMAGMASAAKVKAAPNCAKHPQKAACRKSGAGGGATGGSTGTAPNIIVSVSPNPVQEVGTSEIDVIVQVSAQAIFANQTVDISSQQLFLDCLSLAWRSSADNTPSDLLNKWGSVAGVTGIILDNDGNATVELQGEDCAPGQNLIEADLEASPYTTATATLRALPPQVTAHPTITTAPNPEVETGDGAPNNSESQVYVNFLIEEDPVYAEQIVDVTSNQLTSRCELGKTLWSSTPGLGGGGLPIGNIGVNAVLDNDGNAVVTFEGISCAAGDSLVDAELVGGTGDSFTTDFLIKPPAPQIPPVTVL
ncbi:MAG TPA: hypothetical protein VIJ09_07410 [Acidimicrobiales bacterium]